MKNLWNKKIFSIILTIIFFLLIMEIIARQVEDLTNYKSNVRFTEHSDPENLQLFRISPTPGLGYDLKPDNYIIIDGIHFQTNSKGIRDEEFEIPKPEGTFRIVVLGDSTTFGDGVQYFERFSDILNEYLKNHTQKFEVINAAIPGYNIVQKLILFQTRILEYEPDLVIFQFANDDYMKNSIHVATLSANEDKSGFSEEIFFAHNMPEIMPIPRKVNIFLLEKLSIYRHFNMFVYNILSKINPIEYYPNAYRFLDGLDAVNLNRNALKELYELSVDNNFDLFIVLTPNLESEDNNDAWIKTEPYKLYKIKTLDLHPLLMEKEINWSSIKLFTWDYTHPLYEGHVLFANEIYQFMMNESYISN